MPNSIASTALSRLASSVASTFCVAVSDLWLRLSTRLCLPAIVFLCLLPATTWAATAAPTGLAASSITVTSFTLKWTAVSGAASYQIFKGGVLAGTSTTTSFNVTGLSPATTYSMTVKAKDSAGALSAASTALSVKTATDTAAPTVPTGLAASSIAAASFTLKWTASTDNAGVSSYLIFKNAVQVGTSTTTSFNVVGLSPSASYSMTVKAKDSTGNTSAASAALSVTTIADTSAPTVPTGLASSSLAATSFTLKWTASTDNVGVSSYLVFKNGVQIGTSATASFNVTGLTPSTAYSMTVKAKDSAGNTSAASAALSVTTTADTTAPSAPAGLAASTITATSFILQWTASTDNVGVVGYNIYKGATLAGTSATTSFNVTGLSPATSYSMTVKAKDAAGNLSVASSALSVTTLASTGTAPTATLTAPTANSVFTLPKTITLTATAAATNATVTKVEFFSGSTKLGEDLSSPYQYTWTPNAPGNISLTARATDSKGLTGTSAPVTIRLLPSLPYTADFETSEGYAASSIAGQLGWTVTTGTATIVTSAAVHGTQGVVLAAQSPATEVDHEFGSLPPNATIVYADLFAKPVAGSDYLSATLLDLDAGRIAFVKTGTSGQFAALDGDGLGAGVWKNFGASVTLDVVSASSAWQRVTARLNYTAKTWDLYVNGAMIAADLKFRLNTASYFSWLSLKGHTATAVQLDDIYIGAPNPLFADTNNNGIDDTWETSNGLSLTAPNRDLDPDGDGRTNIQEYLQGTNPNDFYNGSPPKLLIVSGLNQITTIKTFNTDAFTVRALNPDGSVIGNAPIIFNVVSGGGGLASQNTGTQTVSTQLSVRTSGDGTARVYYKQPSTIGVQSLISASAGTGQVSFTTLSAASFDTTIDTDLDGIPDGWAKRYGLSSGSANEDYDNDGVTNINEFRNGTNPKDYYNGKAPVIEILAGSVQEPGLLEVRVTQGGAPLINAPLSFSSAAETIGFATNPDSLMVSTSMQVMTGPGGTAKVYLKQVP